MFKLGIGREYKQRNNVSEGKGVENPENLGNSNNPALLKHITNIVRMHFTEEDCLYLNCHKIVYFVQPYSRG